MRKNLQTLGLSLIMGISLTAQTNLNFENWSGNEPNDWGTVNGLPGAPQTTFEETTSPGQGSSSVRLVTQSCPTCSAFFSSDPLPGVVFQEIPFTQKPISLDFLYMSNPQTGDMGGVSIQVTKWNSTTQEREVIGEGWFTSQIQTNTWTSVNIPVSYISNDIPDTLSIAIVSSVGHSLIPIPGIPTPIHGSEFFVDALNLNLPSCAGLTVTTSGTDETSVFANDGTATVNPSGGTSPYTYLWDTGATTQTISNLAPGLYNCVVTDANGCVKVSSYYNVLLGGCNGLSVTVSSTNSSTLTANDGSVQATVTGGASPYTYLWNTGASTSSINNLDVGAYVVQVIDASGNCAQWGYGLVDVGAGGGGTGIGNVSMPDLIHLYPNPTQSKINIDAQGAMSQVTLVNAVGQTVYTTFVNATSAHIDISNQPNGIYMLSVLIEGQGHIVKRVVVQH